MSMIKEYSTEIKVGVLVFMALVVAGVFLWLLGDYTPIGRTYNVYVLYNFAGGVELGTPVRVSGIKVGKVTNIEFLPPSKAGADANEISLKLKLNISRTVRERVRHDSEFFVNQAGIIGERYIEISPGTVAKPEIKPGEVVRGVDPPRFDQLISQGMDLFGEVTRIIEENKEGIEAATEALAEAGKLLNQLLDKMNAEDIRTLRRVLHRTDRITADLEVVLRQLRNNIGATLSDLRRVLRDARPVLERADRLLKDIDDLAQEVRDLPEERKEEIRAILSRMTDTAEQLQNVITRFDAFTAMAEKQYPDLDRAKIEQLLRQFLQEEGIKINVGEVKFRSKDKEKE